MDSVLGDAAIVAVIGLLVVIYLVALRATSRLAKRDPTRR